jgi:hypothetical protein
MGHGLRDDIQADERSHREYTCRSVARWRPWAAIRRFGGLLNMNEDSKGQPPEGQDWQGLPSRINPRTLAAQGFDL